MVRLFTLNGLFPNTSLIYYFEGMMPIVYKTYNSLLILIMIVRTAAIVLVRYYVHQ